MARRPESSALDFSESSLLTGRFSILAMLACGVGFSLYGRLPAALFFLAAAAVAARVRPSLTSKALSRTDPLPGVLTDTMPAKFYCNCSKERIEKAIISIGKKDIQSMIDDGEDIEVKCHFCNTAYNYTVDELKELLKKSR